MLCKADAPSAVSRTILVLHVNAELAAPAIGAPAKFRAERPILSYSPRPEPEGVQVSRTLAAAPTF